MIRLWGRRFSLEEVKNSMPSASESGGVIGTSATVTVVVAFFLTSGSSEKSCL